VAAGGLQLGPIADDEDEDDEEEEEELGDEAEAPLLIRLALAAEVELLEGGPVGRRSSRSMPCTQYCCSSIDEAKSLYCRCGTSITKPF